LNWLCPRDKRRAVRLALDFDDDRSNREIGKHVGVSHTFVANCRSELGAQGGEQMEIGTQYETDAEEKREEADALFAAGAFDSAKPAYEKVIAVSRQEARTPLEERVRLCEEKAAPLNRERRIFSRLAIQRGSEWCAVCGVEVDHTAIVARLSWTEIALCPACVNVMQEMARPAREPAQQTDQAEAAE
jgi:hypothetical protein